MSLDKVKTTVLDAAKARADKLLAEARQEAERIRADGRAADERAGLEVVRDARLRLERETTRELERIQAENRLQILSAKNQAIGEVFKRVQDRLSAMSDDDYVGMIAGWLTALPADAGGVLRVNPKDEGKFADRLDKLNQGRDGGGKFTRVEADPKVVSGAVVDGPQYTIDCTIGRRLGELRETTAGDLARVLFGA